MTIRNLVLFSTLILPSSAMAVPDDCNCGPSDKQRSRFERFANEIADAGSADEARELALENVAPARNIVDKAAKLVPGDKGLAESAAKMDAFERDVRRAQTPDQVADSFRALNARGVGCQFTTGEIIATVLGFILGIIPGIILLIVLC